MLWLAPPTLRARHLRNTGADHAESQTAEGDAVRLMLGGMHVHPRYYHLSRLESPMVFAAAPLALKVVVAPGALQAPHSSTRTSLRCTA